MISVSFHQFYQFQLRKKKKKKKKKKRKKKKRKNKKMSKRRRKIEEKFWGKSWQPESIMFDVCGIRIPEQL